MDYSKLAAFQAFTQTQRVEEKTYLTPRQRNSQQTQQRSFPSKRKIYTESKHMKSPTEEEHKKPSMKSL